MAKVEYFSLEGLRLDGRRKDEPRNTKLYCGSDCSVDFLDYDGVSELIQGLNKVQVLVKGPQEDPRSSKNSYGIAEERIDIRCEIVIATEKKVKNSQNERIIKDLSLSVKSTYQEMIISHYYKGCSLNVFVNILEFDGSIKSTVINAVGVALVDAGVAIKDLVSSSTVINLDSIILTDPNQMELNASTAVLCVAVESSTDKIIYMDYKSKIHLEEINHMVQAAFAASKKFTDYAREVLRNYSKKVVYTMDRMRLSAPSNYYWNISFAYERFKKDPLDYIIFLLFVGHVVGFFGFLIYLKVQTSRKKLFMYHN